MNACPHRSLAAFAAALALWAGASIAHAQQVYKCTDANGKTTYGDAACDAGAKPLKLPTDPTKGTGTNPRVCEQMLDELRRLAAEADRTAKRGGTDGAASVKRRQSLTRQYEERCVGISRSDMSKG